jgi:hypothetical protein
MRRAAAALLAAALLITPAATAQLATRPATLVWDKGGLLRGTFNYQDAIDDAVKKRIAKGLVVTIVMRGYVYYKADKSPVALTAHTCKVAYDLWTEVFKVVVNGVTKPPVANMKGVYRLCTDMVDLPIVERKVIKGSAADYYLAVHVEVNPVSEKLINQMEAWVKRPLVSGTISTGDALFATFVSVFMQKSVATADKIVDFRTGNFPP